MSASTRDRRQWPYVMWLLDQHGNPIIETVHASESSLQMEVRVSAKRVAGGKPNHGGQIPSRIAVDGLPESVWKPWTVT